MDQLIHLDQTLVETSTKSKIYQKSELVYAEDSPAHGLYFIERGTVKVYISDKNGREIILRLASEGDIFGHGFFFGQRNNSNSARAIEETQCKYINKTDFQNLMIHKPELALEFMKKIGKELIMVQDRCVDLIKKNVRERLASHFYYMAKNHSEASQEGLKIKLQLSREEIASIIGTANETAIRFISEFKELGLIKEQDRFFHILNEEQIATIGRIN